MVDVRRYILSSYNAACVVASLDSVMLVMMLASFVIASGNELQKYSVNDVLNLNEERTMIVENAQALNQVELIYVLFIANWPFFTMLVMVTAILVHWLICGLKQKSVPLFLNWIAYHIFLLTTIITIFTFSCAMSATISTKTTIFLVCLIVNRTASIYFVYKAMMDIVAENSFMETIREEMSNYVGTYHTLSIWDENEELDYVTEDVPATVDIEEYDEVEPVEVQALPGSEQTDLTNLAFESTHDGDVVVDNHVFPK